MAVMQSTPNTAATEMELILSIVQEELVRTAKLRPTIRDFSAGATKGIKSIEIPRYDTHFSDPQAQPADGTSVTAQDVTFVTDKIDLDKFETLPYEIPDQVSLQTTINLEAELAASAGRKIGNRFDDCTIAELRLAADGTGGLPDHIIQLSGAANLLITVSDIAEARRLLNRAEVREDSRFLLVSPEQEKAMLDIENFIRADQYGSREALLTGEIGKVFNFRVMVHNGLIAAEAIAYQSDAVGYAIQKEMRFETRRADLKKQLTEYAFSYGWGFTVLEQGVKQVLLNATGT